MTPKPALLRIENVRAALQAQQGEARMRVGSERVCVAERLLGGVEVTHAELELPELVEREPGDVGCEVVEFADRTVDLLLRLGPAPAEPHHLGTVDPA